MTRADGPRETEATMPDYYTPTGRPDLDAALLRASAAAGGDSNDTEIEALQDALGEALQALAVPVSPQDPRGGTFAALQFPGGVGALPGTWKLEHQGFGLWGFVGQVTGDFVPVDRVNRALRVYPSPRA